MTAFGPELDVAKRLAREAGLLVMRYRDGGDLRVELKADDSPVTVADRQSSRMIIDGLAAAFPDDIIISEESADDLRRLDARRVWYIDPIDGTKDFIAGREGFAVMIGLCVDHRPTVGAVYTPASERLFYAATDHGAYLDVPGRPPRRLRVSDQTDVGAAQLVASASHRDDTIERVKSALGIDNELNIGSVGLKLGLISLAERDLYVNPSPRCKTWDTCGPEVILHAAGGRMTDLHGDPLRYDERESLRLHGMVASNGHIHDAAVARLAALFPRQTDA